MPYGTASHIEDVLTALSELLKQEAPESPKPPLRGRKKPGSKYLKRVVVDPGDPSDPAKPPRYKYVYRNPGKEGARTWKLNDEQKERLQSPEAQAGVEAINALKESGHEAYLVGGAVRDLLLGKEPKDYDVVTSAKPDEVKEVFPKVYAVGEQFAITPVRMGDEWVEIATYRTETGYSDKRRPDEIKFADSLEEDAKRRDFTINGLYLDPESNEVVDAVGGMKDLKNKTIRTIGDPEDRFNEDALRLMRAVRFASTLGFDIDPDTEEAIKKMADNIDEISHERIRDELAKILKKGGAARGVSLLDKTGLLEHILPEVHALHGVEQSEKYHPEGDAYKHTVKVLRALDEMKSPSLELAFAALLHDVGKAKETKEEEGKITSYGHDKTGAEMVEKIGERLKLPRKSIDRIRDLVKDHMVMHFPFKDMSAKNRRKWMMKPHFEELLELGRLDKLGGSGDLSQYRETKKIYEQFKEEREKYQEPIMQGRDLIDMGFKPGAYFGRILQEVRDLQLDGKIETLEEAKKYVESKYSPEKSWEDPEQDMMVGLEWILKFRERITQIDPPDPAGVRGKKRESFRLTLASGKRDYVDKLPEGTRPGHYYDTKTGRVITPKQKTGTKEALRFWSRPGKAFSEEFGEKLNRAAIDAAQHRGKVTDPGVAGTVSDALSPELLSSIPEKLHGVPVVFASKINDEPLTGFASGKDKEGNHVIVMHPEQTPTDRVKGLLHELMHVQDKMEGKEVSVTGAAPKKKEEHEEYVKLASEKRAEKKAEEVLTDAYWKATEGKKEKSPESLWIREGTKSPYFKRWFGDWEKNPEDASKVVDDEGKPLTVYHGTTNLFDAFNTKAGNPENDFGKGAYFTNTEEDVNVNYAGEGPDLTQRIELLAEKLEQEEEISHEEAKKRAKERLSKHAGAVIPAYLNIRNPVRLGGEKETFFDYEYGPSEDDIQGFMDDAKDRLMEEYNVEEGEDPEDYFDEDDVRERAREIAIENGYEQESGKLLEFFDALREASWDYEEVDIPQAISDVMDEAYDGISASDLISKLRKSEGLAYATDDEGNLASTEIIREALEKMGFDGVIDHTVPEKFGPRRKQGKAMEGVTEDTVHYIAFQPNQIKSAIGNKGTFDPDNPAMVKDILRGLEWFLKDKDRITNIDPPDPMGQGGRKRDSFRLTLSSGKRVYLDKLPEGTKPGHTYDSETGRVSAPKSGPEEFLRKKFSDVDSVDELETAIGRLSKEDKENLKQSVKEINEQYLNKFEGMPKLYHGTTHDIASKIKEEGFRLTEGRRSGFLGAEKKVKNQAVFLSDDKSFARAYGANRDPHGGADTEVLEVRADINNTLDMRKWGSHIPKELRKIMLKRLSDYEGKKVKRPKQSDMFWLLDQPKIVEAIKDAGYDSVDIQESRATRRELGIDSGSTVAVLDPKNLHIPKPPIRTMKDLFDLVKGDKKEIPSVKKKEEKSWEDTEQDILTGLEILLKDKERITQIDPPDPMGQAGRKRESFRLTLASGKRHYVDKLPEGTKPGHMYDPETGKVSSPKKEPKLLTFAKSPYGDKFHYLHVNNDTFVHFTTPERAKQIVESGKLLMKPPYEKFGTDTVDAVSLTYGESVPGVQTTHIKGDDVVAVKFRTKTKPKYGTVEEVKWDRDVDLIDPEIVPSEKAVKALKKSPGKIDEDDHVIYDKDKAKEIKEYYEQKKETPKTVSMQEVTEKYPKVKEGKSDGRIVREEIPNLSSIGASLDNYEVVPGIRDVPLSEFDLSGRSYDAAGTDRIKKLAEEIKESGEINPLIVVRDDEGLYILEGGHRAEALYRLGAKSLPAKLVIDTDSVELSEEESEKSIIAGLGWVLKFRERIAQIDMPDPTGLRGRERQSIRLTLASGKREYVDKLPEGTKPGHFYNTETGKVTAPEAPGAQTGKPWKGTVYRGQTRAGESGAAHGVGKYYGLTHDIAERFSKPGTVEEHKIHLSNPAVVRSDKDLKKLKMKAEEDTGRDFGKKGNLYEMLRPDQAKAFTRWMMDQGYDGMIVDYPEAAGGRQAVVFPSQEKEEKAPEKMTYEEARSSLENIRTKEDLKKAEPLLRMFFPEWTETEKPDTSNDFAYGIWRMANKQDEIHRIPFSDFSKRYERAKVEQAQRLWQEKGVKSPHFKEWFGDWENDPENASKVVDEEGKPRKVYHGTKKEFEEFDRDKLDPYMLDRQLGFHFAVDPAVASSFAGEESTTHRQEGSGSVMPVYLNIRNPKKVETGKAGDQFALNEEIIENVFDDKDTNDLFVEWAKKRLRLEEDEAKEVLGFLRSGKPVPDKYGVASSKHTSVPDYVSDFDSGLLMLPDEDKKKVVDKYLEEMKKKGYDGIVYENTSPVETKEAVDQTTYIAFQPEQVKSATGNRGTFDPDSSNIKKEERSHDSEEVLEGLDRLLDRKKRRKKKKTGFVPPEREGTDLAVHGTTINILPLMDQKEAPEKIEQILKDKESKKRSLSRKRYFWSPDQISVKESKVEKQTATLSPPAPPKPSMSSPKMSFPKPSRTEEERGFPLWHVSDWEEGPHIKTPKGWVPYDPVEHGKLRVDPKKLPKAEKIKKGFSALGKERLELKEKVKKKGLNFEESQDLFGAWLDDAQKFLREHSDFLEDVGIPCDELESVLDETFSPGESGEMPYDPSDHKNTAMFAAALMEQIQEDLENLSDSRGVPGKFMELVDDEKYRVFGNHWEAMYWSHSRGKRLEEKLDDDQVEAVSAYGGGTGRGDLAERINRAYRNEDFSELSEEDRETVKHLDEAARKGTIDENVLAFRGMNLSGLVDRLGLETLEDLEGKTIEDEGFTSVSTDSAVASGFARRSPKAGVVSVLLPEGSHAVPADPMKVKYRNEGELILPRGSRFRVVKVSPSKATLPKIMVKYLGPSESRRKEIMESSGQRRMFSSKDAEEKILCGLEHLLERKRHLV